MQQSNPNLNINGNTVPQINTIIKSPRMSFYTNETAKKDKTVLSPYENRALRENAMTNQTMYNQKKMFDNFSNHEVLVMPSKNLPLLDNLPRVKIIDNINLNIRRKKPKIEETLNHISIKLVKKSSRDFMQGLTELKHEMVSKRYKYKQSESISVNYN